MTVYIPLWFEDTHQMPNPFVTTLTDAIINKHPDMEFYFGTELLWKKECESFDIVHFMWPHIFDKAMQKGYDLDARIKELKSKGVKIISTCHNLKSHIKFNEYSHTTYNIVYSNSSVIIHLGPYSLNLLKEKYPDTKHITIHHHIYDSIYTKFPSRNESLRYLNLTEQKKYILCFGAFRNDQEKRMICSVAKQIKSKGYRILAPSIIELPYKRRNPLAWILPLARKIQYRYYGIITQGKFVKDEELPYYFGSSDISLLQRFDILNSGNLPLSFYMGKVVIGPKVGNIEALLQETSNPSFDPYNTKSIIQAIEEGFNLVSNGKGEMNYNYAIANFSTEVAAEKHYQLYKNLLAEQKIAVFPKVAFKLNWFNFLKSAD